MTGILGREACYSGQEITWDDAMKSTTHLGPKEVQIRPVRNPAGREAGDLQIHVELFSLPVTGAYATANKVTRNEVLRAGAETSGSLPRRGEGWGGGKSPR